MKIFFSVLILITLSSVGAYAMSKDGCGGDCAGCHKLTVKEANDLVKSLGGKVTQVKNPAMRGVWELDLEKDGKHAVAYLDYGKKHIIPGPIFNLQTKKPISGGGAAAPAVTKVNPALLNPADSIIMGNPRGKKKLYVFTDPECPYCAKLHTELKKLIAKDSSLAVYVKLFPLKMHPNAYDKSRVILQGASAKLLDDAFAKRALPAVGANTPKKGVEANIKLAAKLGVNSTPTLILPDGRVMAGAKTAEEIQALLDGKRGK